MSQLRKILQKSRTGVGIQMALAMIIPPKAKAANETSPRNPKEESPDNQESQTAPPHMTGRWDFSRLFNIEAHPDMVENLEESTEQIESMANDAWRLTVSAAKGYSAKTGEARFAPKPMTHEEIRLWLQSFNAGPYACLKYKGDVPYKETKDYVPRVMKHYEEDLETDYDDSINRLAGKYGLEPRMIRAIMKTESDFKNDCVSHAGARGLLQIMPVVWHDIKKKYDLQWEYSTGVFDPDKNIEVGCAYLAWLRYDFLPRHFAAYGKDPKAPVCLVRDKDLGVPDRESPRIIAKSDTVTKRTVEIASADINVKQETESNPGADESDVNDSHAKKEADTDTKKASSHGKIETSDSDSGKSEKHSHNGKTKVVMRGGKGKSVAISVDKQGRVRGDDNSDHENLKSHRSMAKVSSHEEDENQGG